MAPSRPSTVSGNMRSEKICLTMPMEAVSPSPEIPTMASLRLASFAPVATAGMRHFDQIEQRGGMIAALEAGYFRKEIADAIQRQDAKWLTTLPGVGAATADNIVATLKRKVTKFALMAPPREPGAGPAATATVIDGNLIEDAYQALLSVGHSPIEARDRLDRALAGGKTYRSVEDILVAIYNKANS